MNRLTSRASLNILTLILLLVGWSGMWFSWITYPNVAARLNPVDMAEWATFLTEVRFGGLRLLPEWLRLSLILATLALATQVGEVENRWLRWALRGLALIPAILLMPPYPFFLQLWGSESYGTRFLIAALGLIGVPLTILLDKFPTIRRIAAIVLSLVAAVIGIWTFTSLRTPFAMRYADPLHPGIGLILFAGGLVLAAVVQGIIWMTANKNESVS